MKICRRVLVAAIVLLVVEVLQGCAAASQSCRTDPLLHPEIRFEDVGNAGVIDDHIYFSKEGSSGGRGFGGGGCGCN